MQVLSVFFQFFLLGLTSFGGPAAHIGYFRRHFVENKKWLSEQEYGQLIALSQFLPGPGSSQVGFALGLRQAGILGGLAAFIGFTLPSFLIMFGLAITPPSDHFVVNALIHAAKLFAVVVVIDAVVAMSRQFCTDIKTQLFAFVSAITSLIAVGALSQLSIIVVAAVLGIIVLQTSSEAEKKAFVKPNMLVFCLVILIVLGIIFYTHPLSELFVQFAAAGSLVFGGGHVVLPLLQQLLSSISNEQFLTGYAAAQAIPGPMFALASYLGVTAQPSYGIIASIVATLGVFLPGLFLMYWLLPSWQSLQSISWCQKAVAGINAAVVGILGAALYDPIYTSAVNSTQDMALVLVGLVLLRQLKLPIIKVIILFGALNLVVSYMAF